MGTDVFLLLSVSEFPTSAVEDSCSMLLLSKDAAVITLASYYLKKNRSLDAQPIWWYRQMRAIKNPRTPTHLIIWVN